MKIAQLAPIWESVPPDKYGGTELVVSNLTEELVARGHQVTLFATADSQTSATLVASAPKALYRAGIPWTNMIYPLLHTCNLLDQAGDFDIIHAHLNTTQDYFTLAIAEYLRLPIVFTIHMELPVILEREDERLVLERFRNLQFISISNAQRTIPNLNYVATVYNGIAVDSFRFQDRPGDYLVWLGRMCPEKGTREAIEVARATGLRLIMAGKVDQHNETSMRYFEEQVKPEVDGRQIVYLGEIDHQEKAGLLGGARALLNPIRWNEPFGLVTAEAMACGTPVVAFDVGPIRELVENGKTGFIVDSVPSMVEAVGRASTISRKACRRRVEQSFSVKSMTEGYEAAYVGVAERSRWLAMPAGTSRSAFGAPAAMPILTRPDGLQRRTGVTFEEHAGRKFVKPILRDERHDDDIPGGLSLEEAGPLA